MAGWWRVRPLLHHLVTLLTDRIKPLVCLLPVHALIEVLKLQLALLLGAGLPDPVGTFNPLLLKGVAARWPLVGLLSALQQQPAVQVDAKTRLQVHKRHDANEGGARRDGEERVMKDVVERTERTHLEKLTLEK